MVNSSNTIKNLSLDEARSIFMGEIVHWTEVRTHKGFKGSDLPIQPIGRLHCKKRPGHWRLLLDNEDLFSSGLQEVGTIIDMISLVKNNPRAIGYEVLWNIHPYNNSQPKMKALKIDGESPNNSTALLAGRYPFYRVYSITTWSSENTLNVNANQLVRYLLEMSSELAPEFNIIPVASLRQAGWKFALNELVGGPDSQK